ncbi:MAG: tetrahydrofolate dehydrogenase/cyclohydrolase catalytic domain-containing protein [Legionellaceae bacterium]|nr:tetrahydrofolate dehydrogenase/cyclohydrolase catalytic domain-containing protein [Legionellaceae bacterium]
MMILNGKTLATLVEAELRERIQSVNEKAQRLPLLVTIQVGDDPASTTYVNMKIKACERVGMLSRQLQFSDARGLTTEDIIRTIEQLNNDVDVDGILLQHPVPAHINERACFDAIDISKDVDGVTTAGFGRLAMGEAAYASATPAGIMTLLEYYNIALAGKHAVIVGRSPILGKPMAAMLLNKDATITVCHSKTQNLPAMINQADLVIGAVGRPEFIQGSWIKDGAVVIDAGYHPASNTGDIALETIKDRCFAYTPVPGGVGPMTIAMLMQQTVVAAEKKYL